MAADSCAPLAAPAIGHLLSPPAFDLTSRLTSPRRAPRHTGSRGLWPIAEHYEPNRLFGRVVSMVVDTTAPRLVFRLRFASPPAPMSSGWNAEVGFYSLIGDGLELVGLNAVLRDDRRWHAVAARVSESGCSVLDYGVVLPLLAGRELTFRFPPGCPRPRVDLLGAIARTRTDRMGRWLRWVDPRGPLGFEGFSLVRSLEVEHEFDAARAAGAGR